MATSQQENMPKFTSEKSFLSNSCSPSIRKTLDDRSQNMMLTNDQRQLSDTPELPEAEQHSDSTRVRMVTGNPVDNEAGLRTLNKQSGCKLSQNSNNRGSK